MTRERESRPGTNQAASNNSLDIKMTGWNAKEIIEQAGRGAVWSKKNSGWLLYPRDVPDIVAAAQYRNIPIVGEFPPIEPCSEPVTVATGSEQLDLFGGAA